MADFVLSFAVERLHNLANEEVKLLQGVSSQVDQIRVELKRMQCFLKDADSTRIEGERVHNWVLEIREISYDVEDVIETFVLKVSSRRREGIQNFLKRCACFFNEGRSLHKVGLEIQAIKTRIFELTTSLQTYGIRAINGGENEILRQLRRSYSHVIEEDFVGLEEDVERLVANLVNEDSENRVVSICGMGGLGKTTIAQKIYNHKKIKRCFDGIVWACISQKWQTKDVLEGILIKLLPEKRDQILKLREEELTRVILDVQKKKRCLVVIDDIWSVEAWDCLRHAFPNGKFGTKLVVTTRNKEVALHVDPKGLIHEPRLLSEDESWELLQRKAGMILGGTGLGDEKCMEELGRKMVGHCGGLPLAVVVLGGILVTKHTLREWEMVHRKIASYIRKGKGIGNPYEGVTQVLALSYDDLPYHLKPCFLYLGSFPEDADIEAEKIYQMWMAESMLSSDDHKPDEETMMDVAEEYLRELAQRCMVQIKSDELTGMFESCSLHDLMRDLCLLKAKEENFLRVIDFRDGIEEEHMGISSSSAIGKVRRISSYLSEDTDKYISLEPEIARQLRSALFFIPHRYLCVPMPQSLRADLNKFKMVRVLDIDKYQFNKKLGKALGKLSHLRYLSLKNTAFFKLPSSIAELPCLQTLDLRLHKQLSVGATIPNVLWKMKSLRHLYLHDRIRPTKEKLRLDGLSKLEILETFNTRLFDVKDLFKLTNLWRVKACIKVKVEQELVDIINYLSLTATKLRYSSFDIVYKFCSREELNLLEQLLQCHCVNTLHIRGAVSKLPEHQCFSPRLTTLNFSKSELKEDPMVILEKLPNLRSLKLGSNAFVGEKMICSMMGFTQLMTLEIQELPNLEEWRVDEGAMPRLSSLEIKTCRKLKMVPDGLRFISTLEELKITNMPDEFQLRLRVVDGAEGEELYKVRHVPSIEFSPFIVLDPVQISQMMSHFPWIKMN